MPDNFRFRAATLNDVPALLDLMVLSSFGGITEAWQRVKQHGETWQQRGLAELSDANCEIGYSRFIVAEAANGLAGMILLNVVGDTWQMDPALEPPEQMGVVALLKAAQHSVFIREFALFEWARGKGLAREFLDLTERLSVSNGARRITLIVNDMNDPAVALYKKAGFTPCDQQPSMNHPHFSNSSLLVLMEKKLSIAKIG
jgi:ribosomal protein S18 acetylase RimI-like enzyme